jgi:glycosidase
VSLVQQNLFDSHDTDRLASMFVNPDRPYDGRNRIQDNGPDYSPAKPNDQQWKRMMQAVALQMTYLGAPMIYYGNEAGMWSPDDPSNRMPMLWQDLQPYDDPKVTFKPELFEHFQRMIALRRQLEPLRTGFFRVTSSDDSRGVLTFSRELGDDRVHVVINRSPRTQAVAVTAGDATAKPMVDWANTDNVSLVPASSESDGRPTLKLKQGIRPLEASSGAYKVNVPPYGVAVLAPAGN